MFWSFLWRAPFFAAATAFALTWLTGFVMGLGGASHEAMLSAGRVAQILGILIGCVFAYVSAAVANPR